MSNDLFKSAKHSAPAQLKIQELIQELPATASSFGMDMGGGMPSGVSDGAFLRTN